MHNLDPPYAHNDVKPGNVLLTRKKDQPPLAVLMDFGSACLARRQIRSRSEALQLQVLICLFSSSWILMHNQFILCVHYMLSNIKDNNFMILFWIK